MTTHARMGGSPSARLILAPHADDEVMGCGGLLAKYPEQCVVAVCSTPTEQRRREALRAQKVLGYREIVWLELGKEYGGRPLVGAFDALLNAYRPTELYLPYPDLHQDHIAVYHAGMRAARASTSPEHWYVRGLYAYDVAVYTTELSPSGLKFDTFEDITGAGICRKAQAMDAYASVASAPPSPANGESLTIQATALGSMHRLGAVEQYATVRVVR